MATLRSGKKLDSDNNNEVVEEKQKQTPVKDRTTLIVFFGLLIDLLAFTLILPLFPALISHYRDNDSSGLFAALERKVRVVEYWVLQIKFFNQENIPMVPRPILVLFTNYEMNIVLG